MSSVTAKLVSSIKKEFPSLTDCISIKDTEYIITENTGGAEKFCLDVERIVHNEYQGRIMGLECTVYNDDLVVIRPVAGVTENSN